MPQKNVKWNQLHSEGFHSYLLFIKNCPWNGNQFRCSLCHYKRADIYGICICVRVCVCVLLFSIHLCRVHFLCPCQVLFDCLICRWAAVSAAKWETAAKNIVAYFSVAHWKWCAINTRAKPAMSTATTPLLAMKTSTKIKKFHCLFASLFGQWRGRNGEIGKWEGGMACKLQLAVCRCRCCCCYCYYVCCCCCFCWTNRSLQILIFMQQRKSCSARRGAAATACGRARNLCAFFSFLFLGNKRT